MNAEKVHVKHNYEHLTVGQVSEIQAIIKDRIITLIETLDKHGRLKPVKDYPHSEVEMFLEPIFDKERRPEVEKFLMDKGWTKEEIKEYCKF